MRLVDICQQMLYNIAMTKQNAWAPKRLLRQRIRFYPWILEALKRDKNKCVDCGASEKLLVHHIDESRKTGKLNNNLENLVTVCRSCHARRHGMTMDRLDVIEMHDAGMSFTQIGEVLDFSRQRAHKLYQKYSGIEPHKQLPESELLPLPNKIDLEPSDLW